jgi:ankyrin repeat protein
MAKRSRPAVRPGVDASGRTELHYAAVDGNEALCRQLLAAGADPNAQDDNGWTPLHFAAQAVSAPVAALLLGASADPGLRDAHGNTPLSRAVFCSGGDGSVIALLRGAGADPHACNHHGVSPVALARSIGNYDVARFFADVPP